MVAFRLRTLHCGHAEIQILPTSMAERPRSAVVSSLPAGQPLLHSTRYKLPPCRCNIEMLIGKVAPPELIPKPPGFSLHELHPTRQQKRPKPRWFVTRKTPEAKRPSAYTPRTRNDTEEDPHGSREMATKTMEHRTPKPPRPRPPLRAAGQSPPTRPLAGTSATATPSAALASAS